MIKRETLPLVLVLSLSSASIAAVVEESTKTDKSQYTLFNPTPRELMRELSTDRPDKTESAYTVDAGHFQLEMDLATYAYDRDQASGADTRVDAWAIMPANFKVGLSNRTDLQFVVGTYYHVTIDDHIAGVKTRQTGSGDITGRLKLNLWGNDGGETAMAVMPFVKFPTSQDDIGNDSVEGGVILPLAVELPAGWGMGWMTVIGVNRDDPGSGRHLELVNSITFAHDIVGSLGGYVELFSAISDEPDAPSVATADLGVTYAVSDDIQLDAGVNLGLTESADDVNPFVGLSVRF